MKMKVLVAYASMMGSTREVAEAVAEVLRGRGLEVDLQLLRNVRTLDGYGAAVLGAPLFLFHWNKDLVHFLSRYQKALSGSLPVAIFTGGPSGTGDEKEWTEIRGQLDRELAKFPWLHPISVQLIGGRFDPAKLRFPYTLVPAMKAMPPTDLRDWTAIRAWAESLAGKLQPATS